MTADLASIWDVGRVPPPSRLSLSIMSTKMEAVLHTIFLYLQKLYWTLDCYRCLDILYGYSVETHTLRILMTNWTCLLIVVKAGGYPPLPPLPLHGYHVVTQGEPFSYMVFNVAMDAVIRH